MPALHIVLFDSSYSTTFGFAGRFRSRILWEQVLSLAVEIKRLTHVSIPDTTMNLRITKVLLMLHRDDDAAAFILYLIQWRSHRRDDEMGDLDNI